MALARSKLALGELEQAASLLKKLPQSPERDALDREVCYSLAKQLIGHGKYSEAAEYFKKCITADTPLQMRSLSGERCRLLNAIFQGHVAPVTRFSGLREKIHVKQATNLADISGAPELWHIACAAAYRSGYDSEWHDNLSRLLRLIKHSAEPETLARLGEILAEYVFSSTPIIARADVIIPVPTSPDRWNERGYRIPTALARVVSDACAVPLVEDGLSTDGDLPELRSLPRWYRSHAIKGHYSAAGSPWIRGCSVVIVDDIVTTGSTVREVARVLRDAGAKEVAAIALAHTERSAPH